MKCNLLKIVIAICSIAYGFNSFANVNPSQMKLNVYQVAVAENDDCSSPQVLFSSSNGQEFDFLTNPTLGSGSLSDGTYNCIMITMDDVLKFTPSANDGTCVAGTEYAIDLCRTTASSGGFAHYSHSDVLVGTTSTDTECAGTSQQVGAGGVANKVTLYLRTSAPAITNPNIDFVGTWKKGITLANAVGANQPTVDTSNGIQLSSPFVVSGAKTGVFYVDATGQVSGSGGNCEMGPPEFGFRDP